eukprot:CAMPEP_0183717158 /NCGR_PEP_ID=MMETSP0737-20130205/10846_1 /TAXON_ID=385413 /ORGANISM="Thalassiosira miniscula, Strain CCMP1093" /LENGTH=1487 /DNA_ID=CAMNT_0025946545 /DNA_START=29 /DNA_END=4489 /DNA_ORIENTATION=+
MSRQPMRPALNPASSSGPAAEAPRTVTKVLDYSTSSPGESDTPAASSRQQGLATNAYGRTYLNGAALSYEQKVAVANEYLKAKADALGERPNISALARKCHVARSTVTKVEEELLSFGKVLDPKNIASSNRNSDAHLLSNDTSAVGLDPISYPSNQIAALPAELKLNRTDTMGDGATLGASGTGASQRPKPLIHQLQNLMEASNNAPSGSSPKTLKQWMRSAEELFIPTNLYVRSAVKLAWLLTKHLIKRVADSDISLPDITATNLVIFSDAPSAWELSRSLEIQDVQFRPTAFPSMPLPQVQSASYSRAVCAALGNIFLELFSRGRSSSIGSATRDVETGASSCNPSNTMPEPQARRQRMSVELDGTFPSMVNALLLQEGMPISICQLVCDLLNAITVPSLDTALTSLEDLAEDLSLMNSHPQRFLFDRTSPEKALEDSCLYRSMDRHLFGRETELGILMDAKKNFAKHIQKVNLDKPTNGENKRDSLSFGQDIDFYCEAVILSGYEGSGKTSLLQPLIRACNEEKWFTLHLKFDKRQIPMNVFVKAIDDFFGRWASSKNELHAKLDSDMMQSFRKVCFSIFSTIDEEGLRQTLCEIFPNLRKVSPEVSATKKRQNWDHPADGVGSATKRRMSLFNVVLKSLCSAGRPILITCDDLQWADSLEGINQFLANYQSIPGGAQKERTRYHGLMFVGTFRSNEVGDNGGIMETLKSMERNESVKVTKLAVGGLAQNDCSKLLAAALCLPKRHTQQLAVLVHSKTRGNPFFVVQFLRSTIKNDMVSFSVASRRWTWECDILDMQMISDGVAELLTTTFSQLPSSMMKALEIVSCLGYQIDESTIDLLNIGQKLLPFNMRNELELALKEGIMEKAGPIYQFTHDIIQSTIYQLLPQDYCKLIHKSLGMCLLKSASNDASVHLLAVDQINIYCKDTSLTQAERSEFASINTTAAKFAIAASSFEQARSYIDAGMNLLETEHWSKQYSISLDLFEMSASVSCFNGDTGAMSLCLNEIIANVQNFEDSLTANSLLAKLLAASSRYNEAMSNCLSILSTFGEEFPKDIDNTIVLNELSIIQATLKNITVDQVKQLPLMTCKSKLNAMKFLSMLSIYSVIAKPMLLPLLSCRMVRLMIEDGFCDDSIIGLITAGWTLYTFSDEISEIQFSYKVSKVGESLIRERPNKNSLIARTSGYISWLKAAVEPVQTVITDFADHYNCGMLTGDIESAMLSRWSYCAGSLYVGMIPLRSLSKQFVMCVKQSAKHQQDAVLYATMSVFHACMSLTGESTGTEGVKIKSYKELDQIGKKNKIGFLGYHNFISKLFSAFWSRDYIEVFELSENYPPSKNRRKIFDDTRFFFEGIASLCLARQTHKPKWKTIGLLAMNRIRKMESISKWNYENKSMLLQAEYCYMDGQLELAEALYKASIESARQHSFIHEEALASELYGFYCLENNMVGEGSRQLRIAIEKYKQWGACRKVDDLKFFIDIHCSTSMW